MSTTVPDAEDAPQFAKHFAIYYFICKEGAQQDWDTNN